LTCVRTIIPALGNPDLIAICESSRAQIRFEYPTPAKGHFTALRNLDDVLAVNDGKLRCARFVHQGDPAMEAVGDNEYDLIHSRTTACAQGNEKDCKRPLHNNSKRIGIRRDIAAGLTKAVIGPIRHPHYEPAIGVIHNAQLRFRASKVSLRTFWLEG
jgi:hypothetical protein